jgi:hypothetical protein
MLLSSGFHGWVGRWIIVLHIHHHQKPASFCWLKHPPFWMAVFGFHFFPAGSEKASTSLPCTVSRNP